MSRLSSVVGRTPIADKIKIFDASATVKPRPAHVPPPTTPPNKVPHVDLSPVVVAPSSSPPSLRKAPTTPARSQFSAKDPSAAISLTPPAASNRQKKPAPAAVASPSNREALSRSPSNTSNKSEKQQVNGAKTSPPAAQGKVGVANGRGGVAVASPAGSRRNLASSTSATSSPGPAKKSPVKAANGPSSKPAAASTPKARSFAAVDGSGSFDRSPLKTVPPEPRHVTVELAPPFDLPPPPESPNLTDSLGSSVESVSATISLQEEEEEESVVMRRLSLVTSSRKTSEKTTFVEVVVEGGGGGSEEEDVTDFRRESSSTLIDKEIPVERKGSLSNGGSNYWATQALNNANSASIYQVYNGKAMKLDVELKDEKINGLQRDLEELQLGGASEDEVRILKKQKMDLELRLKDQEEELDDLAGQVQMLEAAKTKLEMQVATIKKDHKRELQSKEDELEDTRAAANKKLKILEQQLEQEHEERIGFLRERHELEGKIMTLQDMLERSGDEEQVSKLKKDLKRTKALLRDAQTMLEKTQNEGTNKVILRQLKNQLEDAEFARTAAMKARQNAELELADTHSQLEDVSRSKQELEDRHLKLAREKAELASQLQENEEELQDVMRKYKASVAAVSTDQITIQDQQATIQELEDERNRLREQLAELSSRLSCMEGENVSTAQHKRLELKIRELESKLELEVTTRGRLDTQITRLKEQLDKTTKECDELRLREQNSQEAQKKLSRQLRDLKEDFTTLQGKETELMQKKGDLEKQLELAEAETLTVRSDLKLAMKRIEDLQVAISGELDSDSHSGDSDSSDEDMHSFMEHHRRAMSVQRERESMARESMVRESVGRGDSVLRESMTRELRSARDSVGRSFSILEETRESTKVASSSFEVVAEGDEESHA